MTNTQAFLFFGRSGSGKGTQAGLLDRYLTETTSKKVIHIETGKRLRDFIKKDYLSSRLTEEILENGKLMPEFLPVWIWSDILIKQFTGKEHLIIDGASRRVEEAPVLDSAFHFYGFEQPKIILIDVSRERAIEMMKNRHRADDTDEYIKNRLDWYEDNVVPAIDYFRGTQSCKFIRINGEQSIEGVHKEIIEKI